MDNIKITQVVNAGILIESMNKKILIDGIHSKKVSDWSTVDGELMNKIIYGNSKYKNIDYLLFTHKHMDHFSLDKTIEYINNNQVEKLFIADSANSNLFDSISVDLNFDYYEINSTQFNGGKITYFKTRHLEEKKFGINHFSYIITINNKNILFMGDADFSKPELCNPIKNTYIDVLIAPFIVVFTEAGRNFINSVNPDLLIINHLPNTDDVYNYRGMAERSIQKHKHELPPVLIFQNPDESVII